MSLNVPLKYWVSKTIGTISLSSKPNRNALSVDTLTFLKDHLQRFFDDPAVNVIVLQSDVDNVFSSGHDLREMRRLQESRSERELDQLFRLCSDTMQSVVLADKPVIAKVDGVATAAGCQLVASCDLAYASDRSTFATPGVNIGLFCSTPGVAVGRTIGRKHTMEMLLTGQGITASDAERIGLINRAVSVGGLDAHVTMVAESIASRSRDAIHHGKPLFYKHMEMGLAEAYDITSTNMVDALLRKESMEGIDAFLEKRRPEWNNPSAK